jgi:uncharacterized membrane protein required for colicin V production
MLDQLALLVVGFFTTVALFRGFIRELLGLLGLTLAIVGTYMLTPLVTHLFLHQIPSYLVAQCVAAMSTLVTMVITSGIMCSTIASSLQPIRHGLFDTIMGGALGCIKGCAVCFVLYVVTLSVMPVLHPELGVEDELVLPNWVAESRAYPVFSSIGNYLETHVLVNYEDGNIRLTSKKREQKEPDHKKGNVAVVTE